MANSRASENRRVEAITVHEQISLRPEMYIGSTSKTKMNMFMNGVYQEVEYVPGLLKLMEEIVDNSVDVAIATGYKYGNKISVDITNNSVKVTDNGTGITVEKTTNSRGETVWEPVLAWGEPQSSSNYSNDKERKTFGTNGVGSTVVNIFSSYFMGTTCDGKHKLTYINQKDDDSDPKGQDSVKVIDSTKSFTSVYFEPKLSRFEEDEITDVYVQLIKERVERITLAHPEIEFKVNGQLVKFNNMKSYLRKYAEDFVVDDSTHCMIGVCLSDDEEFRHVSVVNGLSLHNGGSHVDYMMNRICELLRPMLKRKYKVDVLPNQIKQKMLLVNVIRNFNNMKFDSQTKVKLTNPQSEISVYFEDFDFEKFTKKIMKNEELVDAIVHSQVQKLKDKERREQAKLQKELSKINVPKHVAPNSTKDTGNTLFVVEGDSAKSNFLQTRDRNYQGMYPLRGKFLNVTRKSASDILKNEQCQDLMNILGLQLNKEAPSEFNNGYSRIYITADADIDGYCIAAQMMNFLNLWPELFQRGMVYLLRTPIMVVKKGKKTVHTFYSLEEYSKYTLKTGEYIKYLKGLGTLEIDEYKEYVTEQPKIEQITLDDRYQEFLDIAFSDDIDRRKEWLYI